MESQSQNSSPNLLCDENKSFLTETHDVRSLSLSLSESDCKFVEMLLKRDMHLQPNDDVNSANSVWTERCWFESVRLDAIEWILEKRALFGYDYHTAYLAMIYFDRFLIRMEITDGKLLKIQMLTLACLSLAAKMEECETRPLREYTREGYQFREASIRSMEILVVNTLGWKLCCATPFSFSNYFADKFFGEGSNEGELIIRANEMIMTVMKEIDVAIHRPSIIAAAAVLAAYDVCLTKTTIESMVDVIPSWGSLEKESTVACYSLLQEALESKTPPKSNVLHNPVILDNIGDSTSTNTSIGMRRPLSYDGCDDACPPTKISKS